MPRGDDVLERLKQMQGFGHFAYSSETEELSEWESLAHSACAEVQKLRARLVKAEGEVAQLKEREQELLQALQPTGEDVAQKLLSYRPTHTP